MSLHFVVDDMDFRSLAWVGYDTPAYHNTYIVAEALVNSFPNAHVISSSLSVTLTESDDVAAVSDEVRRELAPRRGGCEQRRRTLWIPRESGVSLEP